MNQFETMRVKISNEYIDDKIREMKHFGWQVKEKTGNNRRGKAYTRTKDSNPVPVLTSGVFFSTVIFKRRADHKSVNEKILELEQEYRKPGMFPAVSIPILFTVICLIGTAMRIDWVYYVGTGLGGAWIYFSYRKRKQTKEKYIDLISRMKKTFSL
jgi:hypothetical protein